jgi:uncharacterized protein (DUF2147 family)
MNYVVANLLALAAASASTHAHSPLRGRWENPSKSVIIRMTHCNHELCGVVDWASDKAKRDTRKHAPDLVGTHLLTHVTRKSEGHWRGKLFVPDQNLRVTAKIHLLSHHQLKITGCAMMICKSQLWTKVGGQSHGHHVAAK